MTPTLPLRAQGFAVACPDGHRLTGMRTEGYQALRCPTCGEGIFVLPRSPLPEPSGSVEVAAPKRVAVVAPDDAPISLQDPVFREPESDRAGDAPEDEVEWVDEPAAPPRPQVAPEDLAAEEMAESAKARSLEPAPERGRPVAPARPKRTQSAAAAAVDLPVGGRVDPGAGPFRPVDWALRHRNALVFLLVGCLVAGTVAGRTWRNRRQALPAIAERGRVEGLAALDDGKFDRAFQILSDARRAVIALNDACRGAAAIRQGADEAEVIAGLVPKTLEDLLDEAARSDPKAWEETFATLYKGRTVIVDAHVSGTPDGRGGGGYALDYRIFREGEGEQPPSTARLDLTGLKRLEQMQPKLNDRVTLGAGLASFRYDVDRQEWLVGFAPESGVIMTHVKALEALGWPSEGEEDSP